MKKWTVVIILVVVGILAAIVAVEYLTVPIHKLPSFLGGKHHTKGHYKRRGELLVVIAVVVFGAAGYLAYRIRAVGSSTRPAAPVGPQPQATSAGTILSAPAPAPETPEAPTDG
jgi:hypothetical protein